MKTDQINLAQCCHSGAVPHESIFTNFTFAVFVLLIQFLLVVPIKSFSDTLEDFDPTYLNSNDQKSLCVG